MSAGGAAQLLDIAPIARSDDIVAAARIDWPIKGEGGSMDLHPAVTARFARNCPACLARRNGICEVLSDAELSDLTGPAPVVRTLQPGADLYRQGEHCTAYYTLIDGWVALTVALDDGGVQIVDFALDGAFLGFQPDDAPVMTHGARAITTCRVCVIPRANLRRMLSARAEIGAHIAEILARHEVRQHDHLANIGRRAAPERVAHLMLELFMRQRHRLPMLPGEHVRIPLTLTQIGDALGLTNVHVSRTFAELARRGVLRFSRHRLEVLDPAGFIMVAGSTQPEEVTA